MHLVKVSPRVVYRRAAIAEAITWALLLLGMFAKYVTKTTELGVEIFGFAHGVVFLTFCLVTLVVAVNSRWSLKTTLLGLLTAIPPFTTLVFDAHVEREGLLTGAWRFGPGQESPRNPAERVVQWMHTSPWPAAIVCALLIGLTTAVLMGIGSPWK